MAEHDTLRTRARGKRFVVRADEKLTAFVIFDTIRSLTGDSQRLSQQPLFLLRYWLPVIVNSTGILAFETVLGLNFHVRTVLRIDLSNRGLPVLCAIEAWVTLPLAGSTDTTQTPLPAMRCERASCGYSGRGA
jgi:hypothetical protein